MKNIYKTFFLSLLLTFFSGSQIVGQTIYFVTPTGAGNQSGTSWTNAMDDPQDAIDAMSSEDGGQVWVSAGIYHPGTLRTDYFEMKNNVEIYGGFVGTETQLYQRDWENNQTVLCGDIGSPGSNWDNSYQIVKNAFSSGNPLDSTAILDGFKIQNGFDNTEEISYASGIYNSYASPKILNCTFYSNASYSSLISVFASFSYGGAIFNSNSSPTIHNCSFNLNEALSSCSSSWNYSYGGAICNIENSSPHISQCNFLSNTSQAVDHSYGGAIYFENSSCLILNCSFNSNVCSATSGGIIAYAWGGAICGAELSDVSIINCTFIFNSAISPNSSPSYYTYGGAISMYLGGSSEIINSSFFNNTASHEGGVYISSLSETTILNSILWENEGGNINSDGSAIVLYSCIGDGVAGLGNIDEDPDFQDAPNGNLQLSCYSPCINAGQDSLVPTFITTDIEGSPRIIADTVDMGAYENPVGNVTYPDNIIYVTPEGNGCGTSWEDPSGNLAMAIDRAGQLATTNSPFQVWTSQGTYYPGPERENYFILHNNVEVYGGFDGTETQLSQRNWQNNITVLSANIGDTAYSYDNNYRLFKNEYTPSNPLNSSAILDGFILQGAYCDNWPMIGGAILNKYASPVINNCSFLSNTVWGGNNSAYGGAIYNIQSSPEIYNCKFIANNADTYSFDDTTCGGAIYNINSTVNIINSTFQLNYVEADKFSFGGAIYNEKSTISLVNCLLSSNNATNIVGYDDSQGGAIYNCDSTSLQVFSTTITKNVAEDQGGIFGDEGSTILVSNSVFWGNTGGDLSAIENTNVTYTCIDESVIGIGNIDINPEFIDYQNNDFNLSCFSHCIKTGSDSLVPNTLFDLNGNPRIVGDTIDMGAFEFQADHPPVYPEEIIYIMYGASGCGTSWEDAAGDLNSAIDRAGLLASPEKTIQVWVAEGEYFAGEVRLDHFTMYNNVEIYGGFVGNETQLDQRDWFNNLTILSGDIGENAQSDNTYQIIKNDYTEENPLNSTAILDGFIIKEGYNDYYSDCEGSALFNFYASPEVRNCKFTLNTSKTGSYDAYSFGGAVFNSYSSPIFFNCMFIANSATISGIYAITSYGGAIANYEYSNLVLINCSFSSNYASKGGAISNHANSFCKIINCTFAYNSAGTGGAIMNRPDGDVEIINSILWENLDENIINYGNIDIQYSRIDAEFTGIGNIDNDPLFGDDIYNDLHLTEISPCINSGTQDTTGLNLPPIDLDGNPRIADTVIDMGCYEFQSGLPPFMETIYVGPGGNGSGTSWEDPLSDLNEAIELALYYAEEGDTIQIWVSQGTYYPGNEREDCFLLKNRVELYGGFTGSETQLSERDWINNPTILSANIGNDLLDTDNNYRLFYNNYSESNPLNSSAILDGFILQDGYCDITPGIGGAMVNIYASPVINNCTFIMNTVIGSNDSPAYGGALYNIQSSPQINNCSFISNNIYTASVNDSACGGAIYNMFSTVTMNSSSFQSNNAESGEYSFGGGIYNNNSSLELVNCVFDSNTAIFTADAISYGGAVFSHENSYLEILNCSLTNNSAKTGGAVSSQTGSICKITNSTLTSNISNTGGGIHNHYSSYLFISNGILWGNNNANIMNLGEAIIQYSCIEDGFEGLGNIEGNPMFEDTINQDLHLSWQSPCISAGTPDTTGLNLPEFDLDGNPRIIGSAVDMGCYEYLYPTKVSKQTVNNHIELYPNPSNDFIEILMNRDLNIERIEIIDNYGKSIREVTFKNERIDISNLSKGVYLLKLTTTEEQLLLKKFIKL